MSFRDSKMTVTTLSAGSSLSFPLFTEVSQGMLRGSSFVLVSKIQWAMVTSCKTTGSWETIIGIATVR